MCSHDPIFGTNKNRILKTDRVNGPQQRTFNLTPKRTQGCDAKFVGAFHLSRRLSDENRACSIAIRVFFKITDPCVGNSFSMCSHDRIFGTNKNRKLKNGSCERVLRPFLTVHLLRNRLLLIYLTKGLLTRSDFKDPMFVCSEDRIVQTQ